MLRPALNDALKNAMKAKDQRALSTVRLILAALKDRGLKRGVAAICIGGGEGLAVCVELV